MIAAIEGGLMVSMAYGKRDPMLPSIDQFRRYLDSLGACASCNRPSI